MAIGATVSQGDYPSATSRLNASQILDSYIGRPMAETVQKVYFQLAQYPTSVTSDLQALISNNVSLWLCYKPTFPYTDADNTALGNSLAVFQAAGAKFKVTLWQEPQDGKNNLSASQFIALMQSNYSTTVRQYAKLVYNAAGHTGESSWSAYYPGDAYCDEICIDYYCDTYLLGTGFTLNTAISLADGANPPKPLGLGEFALSNTGINLPSQAQFQQFMQYINGVFYTRRVNGKQNSDIMYYDGTNATTTPWNIINSANDFRVPLLQELYDSLTNAIVQPAEIGYRAGLVAPVVYPIDWGITQVSVDSASTWNLHEEVSPQFASAWNIIQGLVSAFQQANWNNLTRYSKISLQYAGLNRPIVYPIDIPNYVPTLAWTTYFRTSALSRYAAKVSSRHVSQRSIQWDNLYRLYNASAAASWNVFDRVYKPGSAVEAFLGIDQAIVHPIDSQSFPPNPTSSWELGFRANAKKRSSWLTRTPVHAFQQSLFNTNCTLVSPQEASAWNVRRTVRTSVSCSWVLTGRPAPKAASSWQLRQRVSAFKSTVFHVRNKVTDQVAIDWVVYERVRDVT